MNTHTMRRCYGLVLIGACLFQTAAMTIRLDPSAEQIMPGASASIDVTVDRDSLSGSSIGAFDFEIQWDQNILALDGWVFGNSLSLSLLGSVQSTDHMPGNLRVTEVSWEMQEDLASTQSLTVNLGTITFLGLASGFSPVSLLQVDLSDEWGESISDVAVSNGSVRVAGAASVPENSSTLFLMLIAGTAVFAPVLRKKDRPLRS